MKIFRSRRGAPTERPPSAAPGTPFRTFRGLPSRVGNSLARFWKKCGRGILILLLCGAVAHTVLGIYASVLVNRELAELRRKGEPVTFAEAAPPAVPQSRNAATVYLKVENALRLTRAEEAELATSLKHRTPLSSAGRKILRSNQAAIALLRQAALMPECRFPVDWNASPEKIAFPHYAMMRRLARMMAAQSWEDAEQGHPAAALADVRAVLNMGRHLRREPVLISFLVARAIEAIGNSALAAVLIKAPPTLEQARTFAAGLPPDDWSEAYQRAMQGERAFGLWAYETLRYKPGLWTMIQGADGVHAASPWLWRPIGILWGPLLKMDEVFYLRAWKRPAIGISGPLAVPLPRNAGSSMDLGIGDMPWYAVISRTLLPVFNRVRTMRDDIEVSRREREVALALGAYRSLHGRYPAGLREAATAWGKVLPADLYSGKPFIYRTEKEGFALYSVGQNRVNDRGRSEKQSLRTFSQPAGDDIPWNDPAP